jgi:hypothetical protein
MIHPGRIKRGIKGKGTLQPVFIENETYQIIVTTELKDAHGNMLSQPLKKSYLILDEDHQIPEIRYSQFEYPIPETRNPLKIYFSENMDYAGVLEGIIVHKGKKLINGKLAPLNDQVYHFVPDENWEAGEHEIEFKKGGLRLGRQSIKPTI